MARYPALSFGPLPVDLINRTLGTDLEPGEVRLSVAAHKHIARDHPEDYSLVMAEITDTIASPNFIGQAPAQPRNFEMIRRTRVSAGEVVLIAIGLDMDEQGDYRVRSGYSITTEKLDRRRQSGHVFTPKTAKGPPHG
jgi:hypothetical protein